MEKLGLKKLGMYSQSIDFYLNTWSKDCSSRSGGDLKGPETGLQSRLAPSSCSLQSPADEAIRQDLSKQFGESMEVTYSKWEVQSRSGILFSTLLAQPSSSSGLYPYGKAGS